MTRKPISLSLALLSVTALGWAAACSSSTNNNNSSSSSTATNSGSKSSSNQGSSATGSSSTGTVSGSSTSTGGASLVIDDMNGTSGAEISWKGAPSGDVAGFWYTFIGGGSGATDVGSITPASATEVTDGGSASFYYTAIGAGSDSGITGPADGGATDFVHAACTWGSTPAAQYSFAAEAFYFAGVPTAGDAGGNTKTSVDISSHTGIQFWIYNAESTATTMNFQISDQESQPDGGICGLDGSADNACNSPALTSITIAPGWTFLQEPFAILLVNQYYGYGDQNTTGAMSRSLDTAKAYDVQWQVNQPSLPDAGGGPVPFHFCVSDVEFY